MLHEIKNDTTDGILLAGVFDGHAGTAASESVSNILPFLFRNELSSSTSGEEAGSKIRDALEASWRTTCNTYRNGCDENGEVVVDYDPVQGVLFSETRSASPVGKFFIIHYLSASFLPLSSLSNSICQPVHRITKRPDVQQQSRPSQ